MTKDLYSIFQSRGVLYRDTLLLPPPMALEFLRVCREKGVEFLGFDAFRLLPGDRIQPIMDDSLDLSAEPFSSCGEIEGLEIAEKFIKDRLDKDILFEMVIG